jgi:hypothetical protein
MKFQLINIGREKVNRIVTVQGITWEAQLIRQIKRHLLSQNVSIDWDETGNTGVVNAGFRDVGLVAKVIGGVN